MHVLISLEISLYPVILGFMGFTLVSISITEFGFQTINLRLPFPLMESVWISFLQRNMDLKMII